MADNNQMRNFKNVAPENGDTHEVLWHQRVKQAGKGTETLDSDLFVYFYEVKTTERKVTSLKEKKYTEITQGRTRTLRTEFVMKYTLSFVTFIRISSDGPCLNIATSGITFISGLTLPSSDFTQFSFCCTHNPDYGPHELGERKQ